MSIFIQIGNGDSVVFDLGIGFLRNYNAFSTSLNSIDHVFLTHLHMDHISDLVYFEFADDSHWNAHGHRVAAEAVAR
jgi:ribonuclease Z